MRITYLRITYPLKIVGRKISFEEGTFAKYSWV